MQLTQIAKIVQCVAPIDTGGVARLGAHVNMSKYDHVAFIVGIGNLTADCVITVLAGTNSLGAGGVAMAFNYRISTTGGALISVLEGALTASGAGGLTIANATDDNKVVVIEVNASELVAPTTNYYVGVNLSNSALCLASVTAVCMWPRYMANAPVMPDPTVA